MAEQKKSAAAGSKKKAAPQQEFSQLEKRWIELCKAAFRRLALSLHPDVARSRRGGGWSAHPRWDTVAHTACDHTLT